MSYYLKPSKAVKTYIENAEKTLQKIYSHNPLTKSQKNFIEFALSGMIFTSSLNWANFSRIFCNQFTARAFSAMFQRSSIPWHDLKKSSIINVLSLFRIKEVHLVIDDTYRKRNKATKVLYGVFKTLDKVTGGWIQAQNLVTLVLVTPHISIFFGFKFYKPDPILQAWKAQDRKLRKKGESKKKRPKKPKCSPGYKTLQQLALELMIEFQEFQIEFNQLFNPKISVKSITFDAAYGSRELSLGTKKIFGKKIQIISQIRKNQLVCNKNNIWKKAEEYFKNLVPVKTKVNIRGQIQEVYMLSARLKVKAHDKEMRHIVALKYKEEDEFRYLCASNLTWDAHSIVQNYSLRWLTEVVNYDWKQYDGWGKYAFQRGEHGAHRGVILSQLVDDLLLTHPAQLSQFSKSQALYTAGSIVQKIKQDTFFDTILNIASSPNPKERLTELINHCDCLFEFKESSKHLNSKGINLNVSTSLSRKYAQHAAA